MLHRVDWISFTIQADTAPTAPNDPLWMSALRGVGRASPGLRKWLEAEGQLEDGNGRAPFQKSLRASNCGVMIFYGHKKNLVLVEISGRGCERLRELNGMDVLLKRVASRVTRLDVAVDFLTDVTPEVFAAARDNERFKSGSTLTSESGTTVYVGSQKSNRYARVYRYNPPHPRANFLRCEMIVRDEDAKQTAQFIVDNGVEAASFALGKAYAWTHPLWQQVGATDEELAAYRPPDRGSNTVYWLFHQVLPACEKLLENGQQDAVEQFIASLATMCYDHSQRSNATRNG
jgi:DNA relaxase NicK